MANRIAGHDSLCPIIDGRGVKPFHRLWIASGRVLGHIHHLKAQRPCIAHCLFGGAQQKVVGPILGIAADGA